MGVPSGSSLLWKSSSSGLIHDEASNVIAAAARIDMSEFRFTN